MNLESPCRLTGAFLLPYHYGYAPSLSKTQINSDKQKKNRKYTSTEMFERRSRRYFYDFVKMSEAFVLASTVLAIVSSAVLFLSPELRRHVNIIASRQFGQVCYVYYATCYKERTKNDEGEMAGKKNYSSNFMKRVISELQQEKNITSNNDIFQKSDGCLPKELVKLMQEHGHYVGPPSLHLDISKDGQLKVLRSGIEGHFEELRAGDILQATSLVRFRDKPLEMHARYCEDSKAGSAFLLCGREIFSLSEGNCVILLGDDAAHKLPYYFTTYDYTAGWLQVATTSCNVFN